MGNKVKRARVVGNFLRNSLVFKLKRKALMPRYWFRNVSLLVVDMDGTLFEEDAGHIGLMQAFPEKFGEMVMGSILYETILVNLVQGQITVEDAIIDGNQLLQYRNFTERDFEKVLNTMWPTLHKGLVEALAQLKQKHHYKIVLATLSSQKFGELVNKRLEKEFGFSFDGVIGTRVTFDSHGRFSGIRDLVGLKNGTVRGTKVRTKLKAIRELSRQKKWKFSMNQTVLITDGYGDIEMAKHVKTILLKSKIPSTIQAVSVKYKLADKIIPINSQLKTRLLKLFSNS
jgi:phosphoserine phosphatase